MMNIKPSYKIGYFGLVPLVGFFVGIWFFLIGIFKYKDKKFTLIGLCCMGFTVLVYLSLFYFGFKSNSAKKEWAKFSQIHLNTLVKNIEFYRIENGCYPDSLQQLLGNDIMVPIADPLRSIEGKKNVEFVYRKVGNKYILFSFGIDGKENTEDDIFPQIKKKNDKVGWIKGE